MRIVYKFMIKSKGKVLHGGNMVHGNMYSTVQYIHNSIRIII